MSVTSELAEGVRRAVENQPYAVVDETTDGFTVQLDVVDSQWWSLLYRNNLQKSWRWLVKVHDDRTYSVTDRVGQVEWQAGVDVSGTAPQPKLRFGASFFSGSAISIQKRTTWALGDDGHFGKVVDYTFDSREGHQLIDAVADHLGLTKTMNAHAKIGLSVAVFAVAGTALGGIWALVRSFL